MYENPAPIKSCLFNEKNNVAFAQGDEETGKFKIVGMCGKSNSCFHSLSLVICLLYSFLYSFTIAPLYFIMLPSFLSTFYRDLPQMNDKCKMHKKLFSH